jgi:nucleotide-binding universal stress UspA family protein
MTAAPTTQALDELEAEVRKDAMRLLAGTDAAWEFVVRAGSPGEEIVKLTDEIGGDLVVVGSNRHSSLHNLLLGSTAAYLATHSKAPVLVMRANEVSGKVEATPEVIGGMG